MRFLETDRLLLRSLSLEDSKRIEELAGEYDVAKTTLNIPHPYPEGSAKDFIKSVLSNEKAGKVLLFVIIEKETEELMGIVNLNLAPQHKRGELAYWVGKPFWGKGYGTEASQAILNLGFNELALNKIFAAAFTSNPASWRIMEKIGLVHEGTLRQHVLRFGEYYDLSFYGILREDYLKHKR